MGGGLCLMRNNELLKSGVLSLRACSQLHGSSLIIGSSPIVAGVVCELELDVVS